MPGSGHSCGGCGITHVEELAVVLPVTLSGKVRRPVSAAARESDVNLSDETIRLVRASVALLPADDPTPAHAFYARLFELAPALRPMFAPGLDMQVRKLTDMLGWIVANLDDPGTLMTTLQQLGVRHKEYGVVDDHYAPVGAALIWMFQVSLGDRFTPDMEGAWLEAYAVISSDMQRGARD